MNVPNLRDPEQRQAETIRISKLLLVKRLKEAQDELNYLIHATPSGEVRNILCDMNIHVGAALDKVPS